LAGLSSTIIAAFMMSVSRALLVRLRPSFIDDPAFGLAECGLPSTPAELLVCPW